MYELKPPNPNGNNCNGHNMAILHGGRGHYKGDGCMCDDYDSTNIDMNIFILVCIGILIGIYVKKFR